LTTVDYRTAALQAAQQKKRLIQLLHRIELRPRRATADSGEPWLGSDWQPMETTTQTASALQ